MILAPRLTPALLIDLLREFLDEVFAALREMLSDFCELLAGLEQPQPAHEVNHE